MEGERRGMKDSKKRQDEERMVRWKERRKKEKNERK